MTQGKILALNNAQNYATVKTAKPHIECGFVIMFFLISWSITWGNILHFCSNYFVNVVVAGTNERISYIIFKIRRLGSGFKDPNPDPTHIGMHETEYKHRIPKSLSLEKG